MAYHLQCLIKPGIAFSQAREDSYIEFIWEQNLSDKIMKW